MQIKEKGERRSAAGATNKMTKHEALNWMNKEIAAREAIPNEVYVTGRSLDEVMIHEGIEQIAEAIGEKLSVRQRDTEKYPWEKSFRYRGYKFYEITDEV